MNTVFSVVIPARYASTRLPGKMLAPIGGKPMIQHVYERALQSAAERVAIATDDQRIVDAVTAFGGTAYLTREDHQSGTDRLQEAATLMGLSDDAIVVNVQGDEPLIPPRVIDQVAGNLARDAQSSVATLCEAIPDAATFRDPNAVKVVRDNNNRALYFSRAPIPWPRDQFAADAEGSETPPAAYRHIGIYAYRVKLLHDFVTWPMAPLENIEKLEQLRVLWQGRRIHVDEASATVPGGVDTAADLERVRSLMTENHGV
ncbi:3-deoxy-manno-octulosonate cytidylyltransferase [Gilvimarinus sp. F26214L]|uniref:3-deoxy-manno-octulosonate cytidylyltransferase n=1 Tax=Gilvimarinus sp. DZF01 TaxID=3461371 RepID=UPI0040454F68